jgi:pyrroline-5-carboxylate reductase
MAGIPLADLARGTGSDRVVRAVPNAAAEVGFSYTPWTASAAVNDANRATVRRIFDACGSSDEVRDADIDYLTGHSGTGPAYPALLATALIRDAVAHGVPEEVARRAAVGILIGTGRMFEKTGEDPRDNVAAFVDYKGVTAAAIEAMRARGIDDLIGAGLAAALEKSAALRGS